MKLDPLQQFILALGSSIAAIKRPENVEMVACAVETLNPGLFLKTRDKMLSDDEGRKILREQPTIDNCFLDKVRKSNLKKNTFGYAYQNFIESNGFYGDRTPVKFVEDANLRYVIKRYREIHDFLHVILNLKPDYSGELTLKMFEFCQFNSLAGLFAASLSSPFVLKKSKNNQY
ncbi:MAG: Ubiquinone biosynthesis protein [Paramarteilia canceri]